MLVAGFSSAYALHTLSACAVKVSNLSKSTTPTSFYTVASSAMPMFATLVDIAVILKCFGVGVSYLIVIGDLMPAAMNEFNAPESLHLRYLWILIGFCIVAPLSFLKNLDALKHTSAASITFVIVLTFIVIFYSMSINGMDPCDFDDDDSDDPCVGDKNNVVVNTDTFRVFSIFIFGFTCHQVCNEFD
jgi:amino acid permease